MLKELVITRDGIKTHDKVQVAIDRLRSFEPSDGYWLAFSGGKDSIVIKELANMANVKYDAHYNLTTVDPPELVQYIRREHPDVIFDLPKESMWQLIVRKGVPPMRHMRYCCEALKEGGGDGRVVVTGVRWAESVNRKKNRGLVNIGTKKNQIILNNDNDESRRMVESCYTKQKTLVNPIIDWTDADVWTFIEARNLPYCELYDQGFSRLGCIGCPLQGSQGMIRDFERWPKYKDAYIRAFDRAIKRRIADGLGSMFTNGQEQFDWWVTGKKAGKQMDGQINMWEEL